MSRAAAPLLGYAVLIGIGAVGLWVFSPDHLPAALLGGGAVLVGVIGAVVALRGGEEPVVRPIPDVSVAVVAVAFGLCTMLVGAYLGFYLVLIGGGVLLAGLGGLGRELRAERRAVRRTQAGGDGG